MDSQALGLIEIVFVFGGILAFGFWELHKLRKLREAREAEQGRSDSPG